MSRNILLHYHLFKNAGSSIDRILRESYDAAWINFDKDEPGARISADEMQSFIEANPNLKAVSSHQVVPPVPTGNLNVFPIVFLRDPIDRVRSAWLFEWKKQLGLDEPKGTLTEYITEKIEPAKGSVIANFHVSRLSNTLYSETPLNSATHELDKLRFAIEFVRKLKFFGIVERFDESLLLMEKHTRELFPELEYKRYQENVTQNQSVSMNQKFDLMRDEIGSELFDEVLLKNRLDFQFYSYALGLFDARLEMAGIAHSGNSDDGDNEEVIRSVA